MPRAFDQTYFANTSCPYFPCHKGADPDAFNCLFCYCPLYFLGKECGGNFSILPNGVKDCSSCLYPHDPDHYSGVLARLRDNMPRYGS